MHTEARRPPQAGDAHTTAPAPAAPRPDLLQPLDPAQRIGALDVVRGFALLGILLMNIEYFTRPVQGMMLGFDPALEGVHYGAGWAVMAFVQGKFWTLFSLLFGMGFAVMLERGQASGGFAGRYARRLFVLLLIGLAHATLIWPGDILVPYAVAGFLMLLLFRRTPVSRLWKWGLVLHFVPLLLMWAMAAAFVAAEQDPAAGAELLADVDQQRASVQAQYAEAERIYATGGFTEVTRQRSGDMLLQMSWFPMMIPMILGVFLLGAWFMRSGTMRDPAAHRPLFRRLLWTGLPLGALLAVVAMPMLLDGEMIVPTVRMVLGTTLMTVANLLLCLAYLSALVLAVHGPLPRLRAWLAPVGRMALTNYLLQSLVFTMLFYGYGLGLWGQVPRAWQVLLAFAFFALQVLASRWWMRRFRYGPVEWLWRAATYGRAPAMRASPQAA